jgi:hypothetical protein
MALRERNSKGVSADNIKGRLLLGGGDYISQARLRQ